MNQGTEYWTRIWAIINICFWWSLNWIFPFLTCKKWMFLLNEFTCEAFCFVCWWKLGNQKIMWGNNNIMCVSVFTNISCKPGTLDIAHKGHCKLLICFLLWMKCGISKRCDWIQSIHALTHVVVFFLFLSLLHKTTDQ